MCESMIGLYNVLAISMDLFNIGGLLESLWWLLLAFCPKILGGGRDLRMILMLFMNAA